MASTLLAGNKWVPSSLKVSASPSLWLMRVPNLPRSVSSSCHSSARLPFPPLCTTLPCEGASFPVKIRLSVAPAGSGIAPFPSYAAVAASRAHLTAGSVPIDTAAALFGSSLSGELDSSALLRRIVHHAPSVATRTYRRSGSIGRWRRTPPCQMGRFLRAKLYTQINIDWLPAYLAGDRYIPVAP